MTIEYKFYSGNNFDKSKFDAVYLHKDEIESALGQALVWKRLDTKKESRILLEQDFDLKDDTIWNSIFDWYKDLAVKVYQVF